jgi:hypothetical protein
MLFSLPGDGYSLLCSKKQPLRQFQTSAISYKEGQEYHVILDGLKFSEEKRKWSVSYPFFIPPSELRDKVPAGQSLHGEDGKEACQTGQG